mgnify:CR=1 FL=1
MLNSDINSMLEGLVNVLETVNLSVYSTTGGIVDDIMEAAEESIDIFVDRENSRLTFTPLNTVNEYLEECRKIAESQMKAFCNRK